MFPTSTASDLSKCAWLKYISVSTLQEVLEAWAKTKTKQLGSRHFKLLTSSKRVKGMKSNVLRQYFRLMDV